MATYDRAHIQLVHRMNAYLIFMIFVIFYIINFKIYKKLLSIPLYILLVQIILGIFTLISGINIYLAALHQITSILLIMSFLSLIFRLKR